MENYQKQALRKYLLDLCAFFEGQNLSKPMHLAIRTAKGHHVELATMLYRRGIYVYDLDSEICPQDVLDVLESYDH